MNDQPLYPVMRSLPQQVLVAKVKAAAPLLFGMRGGYYACAADGLSDALVFVRLSIIKPRAGAYKFSDSVRYEDHLHIQTQHSDDLATRWIIAPEALGYKVRRVDMSGTANKVLDAVFMAMADENTAQRRYAEKLGKCFRCGKTLTDERSRYYGIGPECERVWPELVAEVDELEGPWTSSTSS